MRRTAFLQAMRLLGVTDDADGEIETAQDSEDSASDDNISEESSQEDLQEYLSDVNAFDESADSSDSGESDTENDRADDVQEEHVPIMANGIQYKRQPFLPRSQRRNILTENHAVLANPDNPKEAFMLFYTEDMLLMCLRETNRKARSVRLELRLPITSVTKDFNIDEFQALYGVLLRAGLDRDNMTALERLWDPYDSRPFYRVVTTKNRFKFFCGVYASTTFGHVLNDKLMISWLQCVTYGLCSLEV
jgi:hypothetical protein